MITLNSGLESLYRSGYLTGKLAAPIAKLALKQAVYHDYRDSEICGSDIKSGIPIPINRSNRSCMFSLAAAELTKTLKPVLRLFDTSPEDAPIDACITRRSAINNPYWRNDAFDQRIFGMHMVLRDEEVDGEDGNVIQIRNSLNREVVYEHDSESGTFVLLSPANIIYQHTFTASRDAAVKEYIFSLSIGGLSD